MMVSAKAAVKMVMCLDKILMLQKSLSCHNFYLVCCCSSTRHRVPLISVPSLACAAVNARELVWSSVVVNFDPLPACHSNSKWLVLACIGRLKTIAYLCSVGIGVPTTPCATPHLLRTRQRSKRAFGLYF